MEKMKFIPAILMNKNKNDFFDKNRYLKIIWGSP